MTQAELDKLVDRVMQRGPNRVMISLDEAVPPRRAREDHGINPDVIFIRGDGWSLGAPAHLETAAERQWADAWVAYIRKPETTARPYLSPGNELRERQEGRE